MSTASSGLFHTRLSPLLNLHRLLPSLVLAQVLAAPIPRSPAKRAFVRQVLGRRELVRHVHRATDGFRKLPSGVAGEPSAPSALGVRRALQDAQTPRSQLEHRARSASSFGRRACTGEAQGSSRLKTPSGTATTPAAPPPIARARSPDYDPAPD